MEPLSSIITLLLFFYLLYLYLFLLFQILYLYFARLSNNNIYFSMAKIALMELMLFLAVIIGTIDC